MKINNSQYTIAELKQKFDSKDLRINRNYQRAAQVWPISAKSYFIDTILEDYPFSKLYFYQTYDAARRKPLMEVVDGQQRLMSILDFVNGRYKLTNSSKNYAGKSFEDLSDEEQEKFLMYSVPTDVILTASRPELLEMFRRMNAYTAPLNKAEQRHSKYAGKFKWFIIELADIVSPVLESFGILTEKQILRMRDAEFLSELVIILELGLVSKSDSDINKMYAKYEDEFEDEGKYFELISGFFNTLRDSLHELRDTHMMKDYAVHSLFAAYAHVKVGIPNGERDLGMPTRNAEILKDEAVIERLSEVAYAHETKDLEGPYRDYVAAATSTTTKAAQRKARTKLLAEIFDPV